MQLGKRALGVAFGITWGLFILILTWWLLIAGSPGEMVSKLSTIYLGYSYSWGGAVIGFIWGFIDGFVCGFIIAWVYNLVNKFLGKAKLNNQITA